MDKQTCRRCAGTGQFITRVENGVPTGPGGICFRCGGKGYQTVKDSTRNQFYDGGWTRKDGRHIWPLGQTFRG